MVTVPELLIVIDQYLPYEVLYKKSGMFLGVFRFAKKNENLD